MSRPQKEGIDYFSLDVDFFDDREKIRPIIARFGPDGVTLLLFLYCQIYKKGYYIKVDDDFIDSISLDLRMNQKKIKQMLAYFIKRSLFDSKLFSAVTVLTSGGIQKRYMLAIKERVKKRKSPILVKKEYWLIPEDEIAEVKIKEGNVSTFIKVIHFYDIPQKERVFPRNNDDNSEEMSLKESKVKNNNYIYYESRNLNDAFGRYVASRIQKGDVLSEEQISLLKARLSALTRNEFEQIEIIETAIRRGWKDFFPLQQIQKQPEKQKKNKFNNFEGRKYDMESLERQFLSAGGKDGSVREVV